LLVKAIPTGIFCPVAILAILPRQAEFSLKNQRIEWLISAGTRLASQG
jgi:hypothetical protein